MWSHTIQSSKPKTPAASSERPAKTSSALAKRSSLDATEKEDMAHGFEADGFSKTSRVHASKKLLTVAKAPTFARPSSRQVDREPTTPKEDVRPTLEKRTSRAPPTQAAKSGTPVRRNGTAAEKPSIGAKVKHPVLAAKVQTPVPASAVTPKAGTPVIAKSSITSPKAKGTAKGQAEARKSPSKARIVSTEDEEHQQKKSHDEVESAIKATRDIDTIGPHRTSDEKELPTTSGNVNNVEDEAGETNEISHIQQEIRDGDTTVEAHEKLNREIALRNDTIKSLRRELQISQTAHERNVVNPESVAAAQVQSLRSEPDSVRSTLVDLDGTHCSTLEKHDSLIRSRDKIIQNQSQEVDGLREKLAEAHETKEKIAKDFEQRLNAVERSGEPNSNVADLRTKDEEIQSLSEMVLDLRNQLEAVDTAKAKEIYDELLRSKDEKIQSASEAVQDLQGELQATNRDDSHNQLLRLKDEEIGSLAKANQDLRERVEATERAREQELSHSKSSLAGEFQDLQNKLKRRVEDLDAAAARTQALQSEHEKLLQSKEQEIKDMACNIEDLQRELETARDDRKHDLDNAHRDHEERLQETRRQLEGSLHDANMEYQKDLNHTCAELRDVESVHALKLEKLTTMHQHEIDAIRSEQQITDTDHQQELREMREKHDHAVESISNDAQRELEDEISRLKLEIEEVSSRHDRHLHIIEAKHLEEIQHTAKSHDQILQETSIRYERELATANTRYQEELADIERLRGQGSEDVAQKHEDQLKIIAEKYQQELEEAGRKQENLISSYEQELHKARSQIEETQNQAASSHRELERAIEIQSNLERDIRHKDNMLLELNVQHDEEKRNANVKFQEELSQAHAGHDQLKEHLQQQKQVHDEKVTILEHDLDRLRGESASAAAEGLSLKSALEDLEESRSKAIEDTRLAHQLDLRNTALEHEQDSARLLAELEAAGVEVANLEEKLKGAEASRGKAIENMALEHKRALQDATSAHDQDMAHQRQKHNLVVEELAVLQLQLQDLDQRAGGVDEERVRLKESLSEAEVAKNETQVEAALLKDELEFINRETHQQKDTIIVLQIEAEDLRAQVTDSIEDLNQERNEAAVEIALLKDRLELAELQKQSALEDINLSQNEANVEIALLKDKLELSDLQSQQDKETITTLEERIRELQAKPPERNPYVHHQLREELAMLARHHAANLADVEALKASVLADREVREEEWRLRAEGRAGITKELHGLGAELTGIVAGH